MIHIWTICIKLPSRQSFLHVTSISHNLLLSHALIMLVRNKSYSDDDVNNICMSLYL